MEKQISETNKIGIRHSSFPRPIAEGLRVAAVATALSFAVGCEPQQKFESDTEQTSFKVTLFSGGKQIMECQGATHVKRASHLLSALVDEL